MHDLPPMKCRCCDSPEWITADESKPGGTTERYRDCLFRCARCGVAYSNARSVAKRTAIWPSVRESVPAEVFDGLDFALDSALNVRNRPTKREKFAFDTSEDAVTWTLFRYLQDDGRLPAMLGFGSSGRCDLLLWGVGWPLGTGAQVRDDLVAVEDAVGEQAHARSEPDVVIAGDGHLSIIEVKVGSPNAVESDRYKFARYLHGNEDLFAPAADVAGSGFYELTRNWVLGSLMAQRRGEEFRLVNLAHERCRRSAEDFRLLLPEPERGRFQFLSWDEALTDASSYPDWLATFLRERGVLRGTLVPKS